MTDFFKFTKVQAPDLSASATLMRGAQNSVTEATNALSRATLRVNQANEAKDTRIRTDNTDQLVAQINQATSLGEVEELQKYVTSDAFGEEYGNGFYIDATKVNEALAKRPTNIDNEYKIKQAIQSRDEGTAVGGYVSGIGSANSKAELDTLRKDYVSRNYTAAGLAKLNDAYNSRLADINIGQERNLRMQSLRESQKQTQVKAQAEKDILSLTAIAQNTMVSKDNLSEVDISRHADDIARQIVTKHEGITYDAARQTALTQLSGWLQTTQADGMMSIYKEMGEAERTSYLANQTLLNNTTGVAKVESDIVAIAERSPIISNALKEQPLSPAEYKTATEGMGDKRGAMLLLDPRLQTPSIINKLSNITEDSSMSEGDLRKEVEKLNASLELSVSSQRNLESVKVRAAAAWDKKKLVLQGEIDENVKKATTVKAKLRVAQRAGDTAREEVLKKELAALTTEFNGFDSKQDDLVKETSEAERLWKTSESGQREINKYLTETLNNRRLGGMGARLDYVLNYAQATYHLPKNVTWDMPTLTKDYSIPPSIAKKIVDAADKIKAVKQKERDEADKEARLLATGKGKAGHTSYSDRSQ